jgi:hypothetical protein
MRETHRIRDRARKGADWVSAADSKRENRCYLHGMRSEEKVTLPILLRCNIQSWACTA